MVPRRFVGCRGCSTRVSAVGFWDLNAFLVLSGRAVVGLGFKRIFSLGEVWALGVPGRAVGGLRDISHVCGVVVCLYRWSLVV